MTPDDDPARLSGTRIGPYHLERVIGRGGMGVVYRALDTRLDRQVAVKLLPAGQADAGATERFVREARTASGLNHPHILTVLDAGTEHDCSYLVMELVEGGTLREWSNASRRGWREVVELLVGVADALASAHASGIVHRDIKPENVLVTTSGRRNPRSDHRQEKVRLQSVRSVKAEAQDAYLLGRYHFWKSTEAELKQAIVYFERAIEIQPDYAEAHAGLSQALHDLWQQGFVKSVDPRRRSAAERALALDDELAEAHAAMGAIRFEEWDWAATEREYRRALDLNPHSVDACGCYPGILAAWGRMDEARAVLDRMLKTNPLSAVIHGS